MAIPATSPFRPYERFILEPRAMVFRADQTASLSNRVSSFVHDLLTMLRAAVSYVFPCLALRHIKPAKHAYGVSHHLKAQIQSPKCVVSVDGGGVRGVIALTVLSMIEKEVGAKISEIFDVLAGTSTGGIIVGGLTVPSPENPLQVRYTAADLLGLYRTFAEKIFASTLYQRMNPLWGAFSPKYTSPRPVVESLIGDCQVSDLLAKKVIITSYALPRKLVLFENTPQGTRGAIEKLKTKDITVIQASSDTKVCQALLATAAAPTYFESVLINGENMIDGGVASNNPAEIALLESLEGEDEDTPQFIFSLGTGKAPDESVSSTQPISKGWVWWAEPLIGLLIDASSQLVCAVLENFAKNNPKINYIRFQVELPDPSMWDLDNATPENLQHLEDLARRAFQDYLDHGGREALIAVLKDKIAKTRASRN